MSKVRSKANNKSPGLSGFTINMLKELPEEVQRRLHGAMCYIWEHRNDPGQNTPESWTARWLCMIPKKKNGNITLDSIRPISLYEVLRKVWTSIITARISKVWTALKALHPTQYGYQFSMGTDTELIQVINGYGLQYMISYCVLSMRLKNNLTASKSVTERSLHAQQQLTQMIFRHFLPRWRMPRQLSTLCQLSIVLPDLPRIQRRCTVELTWQQISAQS